MDIGVEVICTVVPTCRPDRCLQYGPDISTAKITFMKDSILLMNSQDEKNKLIHYSVEKTDSGSILKMRPMDSDSAVLLYFKINKIDQNLIHLGIFKMQVFNQVTGEWRAS